MQRFKTAFISIVALAAVAVGFIVVASNERSFALDDTHAWAGLAALTLLTVVAQVAHLRFPAGRASLSTALIPIVAIVPLFGPAAAVVVTAISKAIAFSVVLKQQPAKAVFNTTQAILAVGLGGSVYVALGGPVSLLRFDLVPMVFPLAALIVVYFVTNISLVSTVITLDTGKPFRAEWRRIGAVALANDLASSSFSLFLVFAFIEMGLIGLGVVILPLLFVRQSYVLYLKLHQQNREVLELLVKTIEAKDPYTSGHSVRVAVLCKHIGESLRLPARKLKELETAALLHDIGKIDVAYSEMIGSAAALSETEREIIRSHPERGARLVASLSSLSKSIIETVKHHHEHYDGNGYPDGLAGDEIPEYARVIMVADTVDAMLSNRPYRNALSIDQVRDELRRFSGRQFDPVVVRAFLRSDLIKPAAQRAEAARTPVPFGKAQIAESVGAT